MNLNVIFSASCSLTPIYADIISDHEESADGLTSISTTTAGSLQRRSSSTRDAQGRNLSTTDENGLTTTYAYQLNGRRTIETRPDGGTRITENYLDGRLKSVTGTSSRSTTGKGQGSILDS